MTTTGPVGARVGGRKECITEKGAGGGMQEQTHHAVAATCHLAA